MGKTTATLPLTGRWSGAHHERCPAPGCGTVYRSKRRVSFRCPVCHQLAKALPTPAGEAGARRVLDAGDGTVYRILPRRRGEGETPPAFGADVVLFLEDADTTPAGDELPDPADHPGGSPRPSRVSRDARAAREAAGEADPPAARPKGIRATLGALWRG